MRIVSIVAILVLFSGAKCQNDNLETVINDLLAQMTLEEKIGQMSMVRHFDDIKDEDVATAFIGAVIHTDGKTPGNTAASWQARFKTLQDQALSTRLGIPLLLGVDAIHGQNTFAGATIFPHNIGMGATHNPELVEAVATITARETQATGFNWTFSPCIAIPYNEKWGRVYEAFSESTELTTELVRASVKGHQGNDLSNPETVMATAKHFIGDGSTDFGKEGGNTSITMEEVSNRLLPPYREAVDQGIGAIMVSFNTLSEISMHAHKELITDSLKVSMGFDGIVVTDWKGFSRFGGIDIINAGVDMVMAVDGDLLPFQRDLKVAVENGDVPVERINDAVRRILRQKMRLGLFQNPYPSPELISTIGCEDHRAVARQAVRESLVLLKHAGGTLPIDKATPKIVVVGEHGHNTGLQSGGWTIRWQGVDSSYHGATSILDGIEQLAEGTVVYDPDGTGMHTDADVAIIVVGETPYAEFFGDIGDGTGKYRLTLNEQHQSYLNAYAGKGPQIVTVLISGRPMVVTEQIDQSDAFIAAWLPGSEGDGIAEVLFGDYNFSGTLPHSWPRSEQDFTGKFGPNYWDPSSPSLFEFGFGQTY